MLRVLYCRSLIFRPWSQTALRKHPNAETIRHYCSSLASDIDVSIENGIRTIRLNRPQKKNAITKDMAQIFISTLQESNADDRTVLTVITGAGDYFTSGMDMSSLTKPPATDVSSSASEPKPKPLTVSDFVGALIDLKKPLVALINGPAIGIGVTMLGLCDAVYCSDRATFQTKFTQFGLAAECCSTYKFPRVMGYAKANELLVFCKKFTAAEALESGLVSRVFPDNEFQSEACKKVREIASLPVKSLIYSKELVRGPQQRELLHNIHRKEQAGFDIAAARLAKKLFAERSSIVKKD